MGLGEDLIVGTDEGPLGSVVRSTVGSAVGPVLRTNVGSVLGWTEGVGSTVGASVGS